MPTGRVMTVRGPVSAGDLGITFMHEHLFIDLSFLWDPPSYEWQKPLVDADINLANRGLLQVDPYVSRHNLVLDDLDVAVAELAPFRQLGGGSIVDLTITGIRPQPAKLREVSELTGLHIVAGCGYYTQRSHPPEVAALSESELLERLLHEIANGFGGTDVRPGIIGEIGTSSPVHPDEAKVLRVAAAAQARTGLPTTGPSSSVALTWSTTRLGRSPTSTATVRPNRATASASIASSSCWRPVW